jgi:CubicO group peptidase (beta-lactamase class C family)
MMKSNSIKCAWLALLLVARPAACGTVDAGFGAGIQAFLEEHIDADRGYGMVVGFVDERGKQVLSYGKLGNNTDAEVDGDTLFEIGSVTKTFTALVLLEMADRGEVRLDDPVAKYLPDTVRMPTRGGREITLLNLAAQDSGLPFNASNLAGADWHERFSTYTTPMMYEFLSHHQLTQDPGTQYQYSNIGMGLLGHVLARKADTDYESLLVERICRPLGMDSTRIKLSPELQARFARGHGEDGLPAPNLDLPAIAGTGGLRSTANDLVKYAAVHLNVTPSRLARLMQQTHVIRHERARVRDLFEGRTALPWFDEGVYTPPGSNFLGHGGGTIGYNSFIGFDLQQRRGVVVLTNQSKVHASMLGWRILQRARLSGLNAETMTPMREIVGSGIMLELDGESQLPRIIGTVPNSPAAHAELATGMIVRSIDDRPTVGKSLAECVDLIRGPAGTKLKLELVDPQRDQSSTVELTRQKFMLDS